MLHDGVERKHVRDLQYEEQNDQDFGPFTEDAEVRARLRCGA